MKKIIKGMVVMKKAQEDITVFSLGGIIYTMIEYIWRGYSHWTMMLTGSVCFLSLYKLFNYFKNMPMPEKCVLGSLVITVIEFISGCIINLKFKMQVWDYSNLKFNFLGQISVLYSVLWGALCIPANFFVKKLKNLFQKI